MRGVKFIYLLLQLLVFNLAFGLSNFIIFDTFWVDGWAYPSLFIVMNVAVVISFFISSQYHISAAKNAFYIVNSTVEFISVLLLILLIYRISIDAPKYYVVGLVLFLFFGIGFKIIGDRLFVEYLRKKNLYLEKSNTIVLGDGFYKKRLVKEIKSENYFGFNYIDYSNSEVSLNELDNFIKSNNIRQIFIDVDEWKMTEIIENNLRRIAEINLVRIYAISELFSDKLKRNTYDVIGNIPFTPLFEYPLDNDWNRLFKRLFDILFSLFVIVFILSWLFPLVAILIKWNSPGPILFIKDRVGLNNELFKCLKFRTMYVQDKDVPFQQTVKGDKRIFPVGKFLRKTSLDEFPQFFNSLVGDISIVGPRPLVLDQMMKFDKDIEEIYSRHLVKPGITGLAQVTGYRGEIDSMKKMKGRIRMDRYYLNNWSFILDLKIIWWTIRNSILGDKDAI